MQATIPQLFRHIAAQYPELAAQYYKDADGVFQPVSFHQLEENILNTAAGLYEIGARRGDHIGLISDNRKEWFQTSLAIMSLGGADVPRGCDASEKDIAYILSFSECRRAVVENSFALTKIVNVADQLPLLKTIVLIDSPSEADKELVKNAQFTLCDFADVARRGAEFRKNNPNAIEAEIDAGTAEDTATIIYTSGTTGEPKGVVLVHRNFLNQLDEVPERVILHPGEKAISVLPVWHVFERMVEYVMMNAATAICYSKPIASVLMDDFQQLNPQLMPSVPRVWESIYNGVFRLMRKEGGIVYALFKFFLNASILQCRFSRRVTKQNPRLKKESQLVNWLISIIPLIFLTPIKKLGNVLVFKKIQAKLGTSFRMGISGGGALPPQIDEFFWAVGICLVEGYGLTETAPIVCVRPYHKPVFGTIGSVIRGCQFKIVDDDGNELPPGEKGVLLISGEQIMKEYYRRPDLTASVLSKDGWLNTGDIALQTINGEIILRGRKKDTIVLRGGENIEPLPIEMKLAESRYIQQAVVAGQDERYLGALIVVSKDDVLAYAQENSVQETDYKALLENPEIQKLIEAEITSLINAKQGFRLCERINRFVLLEKPFEVGEELSPKLEVMRHKIPELYKKEMKILFP